jgi:hypothetical protein
VTYLSGDSGQEGFYRRPEGAYPEPGYGDFPLPLSAGSGPPRRRRGGRIALVTLAVVVITVIAGVGIVKALPRNQSSSNSTSTAGFRTTARSPSGDAEQIATVFLQAWSGGNLGKAAGLTDDPADAQTTLTGYRQGLNLRKLTAIVTGAAPATAPTVPAGMPAAGAAAASTLEEVTFTVTATVADSASGTAVAGTWSYRSALTAYQVPHGTGWFIQWLPGVIAPGLTDDQQVAAVALPPADTSVTDSAGNPLSSYNDPGITAIANLLTSVAPNRTGRSGLAVQIQDASGNAVTGGQTTIITAQAGQVATTISPAAERAASAAVNEHDGSAIVVTQPETGHILAIANNAQFNDYALKAVVAPGSTMKIITATALINGGLVTENSPVGCPQAYTVEGTTFVNDKGESEPASTPFSYDFAQSCNNAFDQWWKQLNGQLASTAQTYYGLNQPWNIIGVPGQSTSYFTAPAAISGAETAKEAFGEGLLTACPLAMASVAATVDSGQFRQPVLLPGLTTVSAQPLPAGTDAQLKDMMRDVVTEGTAAGDGFGPGIYAKTGTADVQGQENPNSWMVAFDPDKDIAIAALVVDAGYGSQIAGPEVKAFFDQYHA